MHTHTHMQAHVHAHIHTLVTLQLYEQEQCGGESYHGNLLAGRLGTQGT